MSAYPPPNFILTIWNIKNYTYLDEPLTVGEGDERYYEQNGRIVQTRTDWGGGINISNGAICTSATNGNATWCIDRFAQTNDASINYYTNGVLSYRWGLNVSTLLPTTGVFSLFNASNSRIAFFTNNGDLTISGTFSPSDRDRKKDINDNTLGLDFINKLQTKTYKMKSDDDTRGLRYGLIYQELEALLNNEGISFAGLVETEGTKAISYTELIAPLIKAVQELSAKVKVLEGQ